MRLQRAFAAAKQEGRAALITYLMAGDPSPDASLEAAVACARGGADVVELGFPYSDPTADGPTIQRAGERALASGTTLDGVLRVAQAFRERCEQPSVLMGYLNPVLAMGAERFFGRAALAGVDGVLLADLPPEEAAELRPHADRAGVALIFMLAPTSTPERLRAVASAASGFIYFVSVAGVTGARTQLPDLAEPLRLVRAATPLPVVVGFGIGTPQQASAVARHADGVVVGSALVERLSRREPLQPFVASLRAALSPVRYDPC
jgi:tryptophan synthase alpha chain